MQKFDWAGIYRDSRKNKTAKNNFLFAVLFKGTKNSKYLVQNPKK
ncbi:hypothetical protein LEP1GSC072_1546 [Leptospira noguchii str. Bonito]|nr:hypothetical protein LEP1GSC072_1546 [Leptospira noguchii str. Bonito]